MTLDVHLVIPEDVHARQFDDELVILDLASGHYFGLNDVGAAFWAYIVEGMSVKEAVERLSTKFHVEYDRLQGDISALVEQLLERKLVARRE